MKRKIRLDPWDITIIGEQSMGAKAEMEDELWFQPSFTIDNKTYLQFFVIDGHKTHQLELSRCVGELQGLMKAPLTKSLVQTWMTNMDNKWKWNGGVVVQLVSIQFSERVPDICEVHRFQVGDCNSVVFNRKVLFMPCMQVHNVSNPRERHRLEKYISNNRVMGVLQCTRVLGNKEIKEEIEKMGGSGSLLNPVVDYEMYRFDRPESFIFALGSDGCFQGQMATNMILSQIKKSNSLDEMVDTWISMSSKTDNSSIIMAEFRLSLKDNTLLLQCKGPIA